MGWDYLVEIEKRQADLSWKAVDEATLHYHLLMADQKKKEADEIRSKWSKKATNVTLQEPSWDIWQMIANPKPDLSSLAALSFFLRFRFTLAKPYISKDDRPFYIVDNPIVRDKVFQLPMVRATSWKGNLCSALWQMGHEKKNDPQLQRLFGEIRGEKSGVERGKAGRLLFYPTFFSQISLEIINPHDRKRRVGKNPILFESVPEGVKGTFHLLYVPFDLIGQEEQEAHRQAAQDLQLVAEGIRQMFPTYGFSAKRTSGYGVAKKEVEDGILEMHIEEAAVSSSAATQKDKPRLPLPKYLETLGKLKPVYLNPNATFRERSQAELNTMSKSQRQEYDKAKKWWEREGKTSSLGDSKESQAPPVTPARPAWLKREFRSFDELVEKAAEVAKKLESGGRQ